MECPDEVCRGVEACFVGYLLHGPCAEPQELFSQRNTLVQDVLIGRLAGGVAEFAGEVKWGQANLPGDLVEGEVAMQIGGDEFERTTQAWHG